LSFIREIYKTTTRRPLVRSSSRTNVMLMR